MKGFILNSQIITNIKDENTIEEMHFYGILEDKRNFIWIEKNPYYLGFIPSTFKMISKYYYRSIENTFQDYYGNLLTCYFFKSKRLLNEFVRENPNVIILEKDITPINQFLMSKKIKGALEFLEPPQEEFNDLVIFYSPKIKPAQFFPTLKIASIDIETGLENNQLYSIGIYEKSFQKVFVLSNENKEENFIEYVSSIEELLKKFIETINILNPQIITGWFVVGFDFNFLVKKYAEFNIPFNLGINHLPVDSFLPQNKKDRIIHIPGRPFIDGMEIAKILCPDLPNYKLDTVAHFILGTKKLINKTGEEKVKEIDELFKNNKQKLAEYNLQDCKLVYDLLEFFQGIELQISRTCLTGILFERLNNHSEVVDNLYLTLLHRKRIIAPNLVKKHSNIVIPKTTSNQKLLQSGIFENVVIFKVNHLYANIILNYKIDPYGSIIAKSDPEHSISTPRGFSFHKEKHFLPWIIENCFQILEQSKDKNRFPSFVKTATFLQLDNLIKVITSGNSRHSLSSVLKALEENAKNIMNKVVHLLFEKEFHTIFCDNNIIICYLKQDLKSLNKNFILKICNNLNEFLKNTFSLSSKVLAYFEVENMFPQFFLPNQNISYTYKTNVTYKGIDFNNKRQEIGLSKRYNFPFSQIFENNLLDIIFKKADIQSYLKQFKEDLFARKYDQDLFYQNKMYRSFEEYTNKTKPDLILAAEKIKDLLKEKARKGFSNPTITYFLTKEGPEPKEKLLSKLDYNLYLEKEFVPISKKILETINKENFCDILKNQDSQLSFF